MTTRETLTRYTQWCNASHKHLLTEKPDGEWVRYADVLARDQAREAEIRERVLEIIRSEEELEGPMPEANRQLAEQVGHEAHARSVVRSTKASVERRMEAMFESLLTPTQGGKEQA